MGRAYYRGYVGVNGMCLLQRVGIHGMCLLQRVGVHGKWCCTSIKKQVVNNSTGLHIHTVIIIFSKQQSAPPLAMEATHGCASKFIGHRIRVTEGRGGGWLHGRYALTPWDTASELLKVEGEGGFMGGMH